jgi:hypothetical protein
MIRAVATVAAILVAAILVSVSVLYASSVAHRDAHTQDQILRCIRTNTCTQTSIANC